VTRLYGGPVGYGHVADPEPWADVAPLLASAGAMRGARAEASGVDLEAESSTPTFDQNRTGSCEAHAWIWATLTSMELAGRPLGFFPSFADLYRLARALERAVGRRSVVDLPALVDEGTRSSAIVAAMSKWGLRRMGPMVRVGGSERFSDVSPANVNAEPKLGELQEDALTLLVGSYEIAGTAAERTALVRQVCSARVAIVIESLVDTAFEQWSAGDEPFDYADPRDPDAGGHAMVVTGFRPTPGGSFVYRLKSSWGESFGDRGSIVVTERFLRAAYTLRAADVRVKESP